MYVKRYRKKIQTVQAVQITKASIREAAEWCGGRIVEEKDPFDEDQFKVGLNVPTLKGVLRASEDDYIIKSWETGIVLMSKEEFEDAYESPLR